MSAVTEDRRAVIGDAAITLLAEQGMRGLTHRAVDRQAELPTGSTSYYARTRAALLELTINRMAELDEADAGSRAESADDGLEALTEELTGYLRRALTTGRKRALARYEFALEATRRPELREVYDRAGTNVRAAAEHYLGAAGSSAPKRQARSLIAWCEGMVFDSLAGAGARRPPSKRELSEGIRELLTGMLGKS